jgi:proteasome lid subunit RPN8/RPN11
MLAFLLAAVLRCGDLCGAEATGHYAALLEAGGFGRLPHERAAFLIRESGGAMTLAPWEGSAGFQRASHRGGIPAGTVAVVHTHPAGAPRPSAGDRDEARRIGRPVIVITPGAVIAALPDGSTRTLESSHGWWRSAR